MVIKLDCGESSFVPKDTPITILTFMVDGIWIFVLRICGRPLPQAPVQWAAICYRHCRFTFSRTSAPFQLHFRLPTPTDSNLL